MNRPSKDRLSPSGHGKDEAIRLISSVFHSSQNSRFCALQMMLAGNGADEHNGGYARLHLDGSHTK
jgi:hypothetical protein